MKHVFSLILTISLFSLSACSSSSSNSGSEKDPENPSAYPTSKDINDTNGDNDSPQTATAFTIGESQINTNYPQGDRDVFAVDLTAGVAYEFSADRLCTTCDTTMQLFDTDGTTQLLLNDDYIGYDSRLQYTPTVSGTYYIFVEPLDFDHGVNTYTFSAREFIDDDADNYSTFYDCDDTSAAIAPFADEIAGDGIDQDCTGFDIPTATSPDIHESDDTPASAGTLAEAKGSVIEFRYRDEIFSPSKGLHTIHAAGEVDYFKITVPAKTAYEVFYATRYTANVVNVTLYASDGVTEISTPTPYFLANVTDQPQTFYYTFDSSNGTDTGAYAPYYFSLGTDNDDDGYYTLTNGSDRDCDDTDPNINWGAYETADDGIDSNCDLRDNP